VKQKFLKFTAKMKGSSSELFEYQDEVANFAQPGKSRSESFEFIAILEA
jgi:hypothetical protein